MKEINTILIANRGEIASRIIRTCKKMGIKSVAVFSDADRNAPYVAQADLAVHIGESSPSASYLNMDKIIEVMRQTGADAVHPGYGFLSENVLFAERCAQEGFIFIGPNTNAIQAMGSKSEAKNLMIQAGVPVVPGYQGADQSIENLSQQASKIGYPVLLKATAGGGGKGMRIVHDEKEIEQAIHAAKREALSAFGSDELLIEKYIASGRHIEFQIFGDQHGNYIHIMERECTIQRRYQKVLEESPSPVMSDDLRVRMGEVAVNAARALQYDNAGTVEFIYDDKTGEFYFLEVNTRLQVEHPVTEEVTGLDLVQMQIESAQGLPLQIQQADIQPKGYALELRLYAEDAANDFMPVTGKVEQFSYPMVDGLRVEAAVQSGSEISVFYDPMIAKLIVWDENRAGAFRKMTYVLKNMVCAGTVTNQDFLLLLTQNADVRAGQYDTHFIQNKLDLNSLRKKSAFDLHQACIAATLKSWQERENKRAILKALPSGWRNNFAYSQKEIFIHNAKEILVQYRYQKSSFVFAIEEQEYHVDLIEANENGVRCEINGMQLKFQVLSNHPQFFVQNEAFGLITLEEKDRFPAKVQDKIRGGYEAPIPSQIIKILVEPGQKVTSGDALLILSSMKMENTLCANEDGTVEEIYVNEGGNVEAGALLLKLTEN